MLQNLPSAMPLRGCDSWAGGAQQGSQCSPRTDQHCRVLGARGVFSSACGSGHHPAAMARWGCALPTAGGEVGRECVALGCQNGWQNQHGGAQEAKPIFWSRRWSTLYEASSQPTAHTPRRNPQPKGPRLSPGCLELAEKWGANGSGREWW